MTDRAPHQRRARTAALLAAAVLATACGSTSDGQQQLDTASSPAAAVHIDADPEILPEQSVAPTPDMRLADDLIPPTNRWFSGLVFGEELPPVFPGPLAFSPTDSGFFVGVPQVNSTSSTIAGPPVPEVDVTLGSADFLVTDYSDATVTLTYSDEAEPLGELTLTAGAASAGYFSLADQTVTIDGTLDPLEDNIWALETEDRNYLVWVEQGELTETGAAAEVELEEGSHLNILAAPDGLDDLTVLTDAAARPVSAAAAGYTLHHDEIVTTVTYSAESAGPLLLMSMPHQASFECSDEVGSYSTIYGEARACLDDELSWSVPRLDNPGFLDLDGLEEEQREELAEQVRTDTADQEGYPADTYFGGKAIARDATLLMLADQLDLEDEREELSERVAAALVEWTEPQGCNERAETCFVYDPALRGVVGLLESFGSEEFNDHHFHYGSFLYSAGVLHLIDDSYTEEISPVMDLLAADIASGGTTKHFPRLRAFDIYRGHSWASGYSPFADGNNQESASEAVNAWSGLRLWADATNNTELADQAEWLTSTEAHSARAYWTDFDSSDEAYDGYDHSIVALNWGGKRDFATWFSDEPSAMLGILILPLRPVGEYLAGDPERIRENVDAALGADGSYDVMFGDYLLMYRALAGPDDAEEALSLAAALPDERIDDGNTRSYLMAWLMVQSAQD